jgi:hypothetical protein
MRFAVVVAGVAAALGLSACYGSTEPATDITGDTATLRAQGTANNGVAISSFEYWPTNGGVHSLTGERRWPAGASGPFSENVRALEANTSYSFRVCGRDAGGSGADTCAQTRTFTTGPLTNDWAQASWSASGGPGHSGGVYARGGPNGQNPSGSLSTTEQCDVNHCVAFTGSVTCLNVSGNHAIIGAVGQEDDAGDPAPPTAQTRLVFVLDDDAAGDKISYSSSGGTTPPNCAVAFGSPQTAAEATVRDATTP